MVETKIDIEDRDSITKNYRGRVMVWHLAYGWINAGIYTEESTPQKALNKAIKRAKEEGIWV